MKMHTTTLAIALVFGTLAGSAMAAGTATATDRAFVAKVSQGGMYEVEASKVAAQKASTQDIRDFATSEVHDHTLVGQKLFKISSSEGIFYASSLNKEFDTKLQHLKSLSGPAFDSAYMTDMAAIHDADGAAFADEATNGGSDDFKAFANETHTIVLRHIGAIHAAPPPSN
jgi:putative membrane protein